jgi:hypothetical protein
MSCILQTPTNKIENSISFYDKLGFKPVEHPGLTLYTDGKVLISVNPARSARAGIRMYRPDWTAEVARLKALTAVHEKDGVFVLADPSNVWIYLETGDMPVDFTPAEESFSTLGNSMGLSLETPDFSRSAAIYDILGFSKIMGDIAQGYVVYKGNGLGLSLMAPFVCPHLVFNPSLTFFNGGKNLPVIEKIREAGIPIAEEIDMFNKEGIVDNVIIRDPGGFGFFVFND